MWGQGLSIRQIATRMGTTHNAVASKRKRLRLPERKQQIPRRKPSTNWQR